MSPCWMQKDAPSEQLPSLHRLEQHWLLSPHVLPAVLQLVLSALQLPLTQECPQHSLSLLQLAPSETHVLAVPHFPSEPHCKLQQSVAAMQAVPGAAQ